MSPSFLRGRSPVFLALKLVALVLIVFSVWSASGLSDAPSRPNTSGAGLIGAVVLVVFLASHFLLPPGVDKVLTIAGVVVGLFIPGVFLSFHVATLWETREHERELDTLVEGLTAPGHERELASYLFRPAPLLEGERLGRLEQRLLTASPEELRREHLVECLLLGLQPIPAYNLELPESLERLSRVYVRLKERLGVSWDEAPFYLRMRDRAVSRIAEVGTAAWLQEVNAESPYFARVVNYFTIYAFVIDETLPKTIAPGTEPFSRTLGSFPMHVLMVINKGNFPDPRDPEASDPEAAYSRDAPKDSRETLAVVRSRGLDFTPEERALPGLTAFLERLGVPPPPP